VMAMPSPTSDGATEVTLVTMLLSPADDGVAKAMLVMTLPSPVGDSVVEATWLRHDVVVESC
jgi:hypothetical protein